MTATGLGPIAAQSLADRARDLIRDAIFEGRIKPDERLTIETVYCLGNCALGPNALVDGELVARLDAERLSELCADTSHIAGAAR